MFDVRMTVIKGQDHLLFQFIFPEHITRILGDMVEVRGKIETGIEFYCQLTVKTHSTKMTVKQRNRKRYIRVVSNEYANLQILETKMPVLIEADYIYDDTGKPVIVLDPVNSKELTTRIPKTWKKRFPQKDTTRLLFECGNNNMSYHQKIKEAILLIHSYSLDETKLKAIQTLIELCHKNNVKIENNNGKIGAVIETNLMEM